GESQMRLQFKSVKLIDYKWEELEQHNNPFAIVVMAHLKTQATLKNLTEREQGKWNLVRGLYNKGLTKLEIINLFKVIDKMMTLPPELQLKLKTKLNQYEEERKMPFLSTLEEMALEKGQEKGAKETSRKHIIKILQQRFGTLPENLITKVNQIDEMSLLEDLILQTISVNCVEEFQARID
ncbi:MAG: hypothetical protein DSM107014_12875, partial [Gomphosphaeria aponina SAG 52.96 = DSM 107014]|nr:hypothetical protein [Gomphosphaeria aponina SAG 52.96 = DSM 107014]